MSPLQAQDHEQEQEQDETTSTTTAGPNSLPLLQRSQPQQQPQPPIPSSSSPSPSSIPTSPTTQIHNLLLLSDSSLPLGSFAFSSGLESYLAHHGPSSSSAPNHPGGTTTNKITHFLPLSLTSLGSTSLPFVLAAYRSPGSSSVAALDQTYDATLSCPVARRASVATGKALVAVWDRAFRSQQQLQQWGLRRAGEAAAAAGHFAPLWGAVTSLMGLTVEQAAYVFLLNHVKALLSAAVRIGLVGPYQAQGLLVSDWVRGEIERVMRRYWAVEVEDAGQVVPVLDLWVGRHELLYSRIFNS